MVNTLERKCEQCKNLIEIDRNNIKGVIYYKKKYYHYDCFMDIATKRAQTKRSTATVWQEALDNIWDIEDDTKFILKNACAKEDLNEWLLNNYDISVVPSRFWQIATEIGNGLYKGSKCKPITMETLFGAWKWGQKNLNKIDLYNKKNHKGPSDANQRIMYDLSIIVSKIPNYLAYKAKALSNANSLSHVKNSSKINYNNFEKTVNSTDTHDISGLLDEIF